MVAIRAARSLNIPAPTLAAAIAGGLVALGLLVLPAGPLESLVLRSGLPSILAAAEPPLGFTARFGLALVLGGGAATAAWYAALAVAGTSGMTAPILRMLKRQAAEAPPRPPLRATLDLDMPPLDSPVTVSLDPGPAADIVFPEPVEQAMPADLDQPMAAYDPHAMLATPLPPPLPIARPEPPKPELRAPAAAAAFAEPPAPAPIAAAPPMEAPRPAPKSLRYDPNTIRTDWRAPLRADDPPPPSGVESVAELIARLERGMGEGRRAPAIATGSELSLDAALGDLRRLATQRR